jgi:uncharacterized protein (TIGR02117 family)
MIIFLKRTFQLFSFLGILVAVYLICYLLVPFCGNGCDHLSSHNHIKVYLVPSGVHTDVVVPWQNDVMDWASIFRENRSTDSNRTYLAVGWGHKKFYMETPTWNDLTCKNALSAACGIGPSAVHARTIYEPVCGDPNRCMLLTTEEYISLCNFIRYSAFAENSPARAINQLVLENDRYYDARGRYSALRTCNTWVADALMAAHQPGPVWTASTSGLINP